MLTIGVSGDFYDSKNKANEQENWDKNVLNPKFGITWSPFDNTTVRGAVFHTFKRTLITDQTLEPTQVAGFNQFYDDDSGTEAWVYGIGVDQKFSQSIYGGAEFSWRDLRIPYLTSSDTELAWARAPWQEDLGRAYLYWTPHDWLAFRVEYGYEKIKYDETLVMY